MKKVLKKTKFTISIHQQRGLRNSWKDYIIIDFFELFQNFIFEPEQDDKSKQELISDFLNNKNLKKSDQLKLIRNIRKKLVFDNLKISFIDQKLTSKETKETLRKSQSNEQITIVNEPELISLNSSHKNSSDFILYNDDIEKLQFYNTIKFLSKSKYYFKMKEKKNTIYLRVIFRDNLVSNNF